MQTPAKDRVRNSRLTKRAKWAGSNFYASVLVSIYESIGTDITERSVLPWVPLSRLYQVAGEPVPIREFIAVLESSPYFEVNRRPDVPIVRFRVKPKKEAT